MALLEAYEDDVEVNGQTILSVTEGASVMGEKILKEAGIEDPQPDRWYPQQDWLNAFKKIKEKSGDITLKQIGKKVPENAEWPPEIETVEDALESIDKAYHQNHRNGKIGHYELEKTGDNKAKMVCTNPYPDQFDLGLIEATAKKFAERKARVNVEVNSEQPRREEGSDSTTYLITW